MNGLMDDRKRQVGFDANIMRNPTHRRFFLSFVEKHGAQAHLSPTAQAQIIWEVGSAERQHWQNKRLQKGTVHQGGEEKVLDAVAEAARRWGRESFMRPSAIINPHALDDTEMALANSLYDNMPDYCFQSAGSPSTLADKRILSETAAAAVPIIISQNMTSIVQRNVNAWLRDNDLQRLSIMFCDEYINRWLRVGDKKGVCREGLLLDIACGPCLPEHGRGVEDDVRIVSACLGWMCETTGAPLQQTGILLKSLLDRVSTAQLEDRFNKVRQSLPTATRSLEGDRVRRVDQAAEASGWSL